LSPAAYLTVSESPASQHLTNAITHHPKSLPFKRIPKIPLPVSSTSTQNVGIFSGFSSIFTSQKNCDLCERIVFVFLVSFSTLSHTKIHNTDLFFYTLTQIEIRSESWASGEKKNRQQGEASCCSVL